MAASTQGGEDWLERALRAEAADSAAYVADAGFTARVLEQLPPAPAALPAWRRPVVWLLWIAAAVAVAIALPELFYDVFRGLVASVLAQPLTLSRIAMALVALGALTWGSLVYALRED